jgi:acyl phosphate:glycerol-3-phosphate acyltransferase
MATAVAAYLLGSIPTGYLTGRARGLDIRAVGSGNIGATNVFRALGKWAGAFVLLFDALKGWLSVILVPSRAAFALGITAPDAASLEAAKIVGGVAGILGHNFTCWLRFKGGKGIATSAGVLLGLVPTTCATLVVIWVVVFALSRYVSLASIAAAIALPFSVFFWGGSWTLIWLGAALGALAIYKHRSNIRRLWNGTENRAGGKQPAGESKA